MQRPDGPRAVQLALDPEQYSQRVMLEYLDAGRLYEQETCTFLAAVLQDGDTVLDVGAHVGWFTLLSAALVGPSGAVWSFEPGRTNYAHLLDHIEMNRTWQVQPVHAAVGDRSGILPLELTPGNDGGHAVRLGPTTAAREGTSTQPTWITTLDGFFGDRSLRSVRVIKIDAEGAEHAIVRGARGFLRQHRVPFVIAEINPVCLEAAGTSERALRAEMAALGYETTFFHPTEPMLIPLPPGETVRTEVLLNYCFRLPGAMSGA